MKRALQISAVFSAILLASGFVSYRAGWIGSAVQAPRHAEQAAPIKAAIATTPEPQISSAPNPVPSPVPGVDSKVEGSSIWETTGDWKGCVVWGVVKPSDMWRVRYISATDPSTLPLESDTNANEYMIYF